MITTLEFMKAELAMQVSTLSMHMRTKAKEPGTPAYQTLLRSLVLFVMIGDELGMLLERYKRLKHELAKYLSGDWVYPFEEDEEEDIYQWCLHEFEGDHCPLGSATDDLKTWIATHMERNQLFREGFEKHFPGVKFMTLDELTELESVDREPTEAEVFEQQTETLLREIEASNALTEFNEYVLQIRAMLVRKEPVQIIVNAFPLDDE